MAIRQVPAQVYLAGPMRLGKDSALIKPAHVGIAGRRDDDRVHVRTPAGE